MIKKKIFGETLKDQLVASANDRLYKFLLRGANVHGVILNGTKMVNEMRANHELGILETLVLGHAYLAVALLSANLKKNERISLQVECSGPVKGLIAEANSYNEVRGYLKNVPIPVDKPLESFNLSPFFGAGFLTVTRFLPETRTPVSGKVILKHGSIAKDMAYYYLTSEQIHTSFNLSVQFDNNGNVTGAGGMFLQAMPDSDKDALLSIEKIVAEFPSIGAAFSAEEKPDQLIKKLFKDYSPEFTSNTRLEFFCRCNKDLMLQYLSMLPEKDIEDITVNGPFPLELRCHNCNTKYHFEKEELDKIPRRTIH